MVVFASIGANETSSQRAIEFDRANGFSTGTAEKVAPYYRAGLGGLALPSGEIDRKFDRSISCHAVNAVSVALR